jgi:lipopolysaccharide transport system permease protein
MLGGLWRYRSFILGMTRREFQARYLGSVLGSLWAILNPLTMIFIYTVVFGQVMRARVPGVEDGIGYGVFLCAGVLTWGMFTEILQRSVNVFLEQANLLKKMNFPRASLPAIVLLSAVVNFSIVFGILILFLIATGRFPGAPLLAFFPLLVLQQSLALGLGVALGVVNVFFRDVAHVVGIALQLWFWFTPIVYPAKVLGEGARAWIALNPMTDIALGYQDILLRGAWPHWPDYWPQALLAVAMLFLARAAFRRLSGEMPDYL